MSEALLHPTIATGGLIALLGYAVVFFGLILLMGVIALMGKIMVANRRKSEAAVIEASMAAAPAPEPVKLPEAKGTAGELKLYDVSPRDAAIIMAIVAHKLDKPINELRFRSIKEVKDQ